MSINPTLTGVASPAISDSMFGANLLWQINTMGGGLRRTADDLGLTALRWPGGAIAEGYFDPTNPDVPLSKSSSPENPQPFGETVLTFSETMSWAAETGREVGITLPTQHLLRPDGSLDLAAINDIRTFVKEALSEGGKYADAVISSFEIGNEYWGTPLTSAEYGRISDAVIRAVDAGIRDSGAGYRPDFLVQVGTAWGVDFDEGGAYYETDMTWGKKVRQANNDVIDGLSPASRSLVDGLISHLYLRDPGGNLSFSDGQQIWTEKHILDTWVRAGIDVPLHYTEWNVKELTAGEPGLAMAGVMIEGFEAMVRLETASAFVWPLNQSTNNDLAGRNNDITGKLSANGAAFSLLSAHLPGMSLAGTSIENSARIESSVYLKDGAAVFFISESQGEEFRESFDLSGILGDEVSGAVRVTSYLISADPSMDPFVGRGQGASITKTGLGSDMTDVGVSLKPYEVIMIRVDWDNEKGPIRGTGEIVEGTFRADVILAQSGQTVRGNEGEDWILGSVRGDVLDGGAGDDFIFAGAGSDTIIGGTGNDTIHGFSGENLIYGGAGNDLIYGGVDNDRIYCGDGNDTIIGGAGDDLIRGGAGADEFVMLPLSGRDVIFDFDPGIDRVRFSGGTASGMSDLTITDVRDGVLITHGGGTVRLEGLSADDLSFSDFLF